MQQRQQQAARAQTEIQDPPRPVAVRQQRQRCLDDRLAVGRGTSTAGETLNGNPQNSRSPRMYAMGSR
jgi:hypothetical protein